MKKEVQLRFFAGLREKIGTEKTGFELENIPEPLDNLVERVATKFPEIEGELEHVSIAVNEEIVRPRQTTVSPGDEVAFLPPFGGG